MLRVPKEEVRLLGATVPAEFDMDPLTVPLPASLPKPRSVRTLAERAARTGPAKTCLRLGGEGMAPAVSQDKLPSRTKAP